MQKRDLIQANASLENLRQNLDMKDIAKEILLEENYNKFIRSYKFQFVRISVYVLESCGFGESFSDSINHFLNDFCIFFRESVSPLW